MTFLLVVCGSKGTGKSVRSERAMQAFPPGWTSQGGPESAKSGMNGENSQCNGRNVVYDEMRTDLTTSEGSEKLEYWKRVPPALVPPLPP